MSLQVRAAVARATRSVVPSWPLSSFIAVNPLAAHEESPFESVAPTRSRSQFLQDYASARITDSDLIAAALECSPELAHADAVSGAGQQWSAAELVTAELTAATATFAAPSSVARAEDLVDFITAKWVAAFCDLHPLWAMPYRELGFWAAWSSAAPHDTQLPRAARRRLRDLPPGADAALDHALSQLVSRAELRDSVLQAEALLSPGWTGHVKWRADHVGDIDLTSYLAVRLTLRWALGLPATPPVAVEAADSEDIWHRADRLCTELGIPASPPVRAHVARTLALHPVQLHAGTWQRAYELNYRTRLIDALTTETPAPAAPRVQVVMCIDPRSEGMRRFLEVEPDIETFGFAGFFGVPIRFAHYQARGSIDALPALLAAKHAVTERPVDATKASKRVSALRARDAAATALHATEAGAATPFALAETLGWFSGIATVARTLAPGASAQVSEMIRNLITPASSSRVTIADAFSLDERASLAENAVRMMGLRDFAPLIVLTGHGSTTTNNLYQAALDCGACGGNPGAANARSAAAIFNDPSVRQLLSDRGIRIPESSYFVAAEHNTVSDTIAVLDADQIPETHRRLVDEFLVAQRRAGELLLHERASQLPGARGHSIRRLRQRAHDWAEVYPELGLAGNAAMIIGPREMTRGVSLDRRVFLHSYQPELDPDGSALETIMTAPMVVAQWINHQYYFSTVDPEKYGAGTKTIHNAMGTIGVLSGQSGDLRVGLPLQSVAAGSNVLHEPMRLSVLIEAPLALIGDIVSRNHVLRNLLDNGWITLTARADHTSPWHRYTPYGWATTLDTNKG